MVSGAALSATHFSAYFGNRNVRQLCSLLCIISWWQAPIALFKRLWRYQSEKGCPSAECLEEESMSGDLTVGGSVLNRAGCLAGLVMASLLLSGATRAETLKDAEQWYRTSYAVL